MAPPNTQLVKKESAEMEFVPFGAKDPIKLSVSIVQKFACTPTKGGRICSDRDAMRFLMLCQAQRLNPFAGDAYLVGYDNREGGATFSLITSHLAFLKRAETCEEFEGMESGVILLKEGGDVFERDGDFVLATETCVGGWAKVYRKGRKFTYRRLSIEAMKPNYETPFWNKQKAPGQIVKCAEADALRSTFPTLMGGLHVEGEIIDITPSNVVQVETASRLVAMTSEPVEREQTHAPEPEKGEPEKKEGKTDLTPQQQLANLVSNAGNTFDQFKVFVKEEYPAVQIDAIAGFDDLRVQDAKNFLRAKEGMLAWLKERAQ
jgi:phage recombination protein Bet